ncbi:MAG: UDP-N-acetylmuramoyl-tripeptide--D-alanyl-D-alanine ligase [Spirochaetia bacterium]|nr:UDP-N-acetylmuramoyl-tripeptide--D-alanyl-D-alanine ligase [Spirochaetia bacterium]
MSQTETLLTMEETLESTGGVFVLGDGNWHFSSVQTDSRLVEKDTLFVPLIGEFQDGHKYIPQAVEKGASCVFICLSNYEKNPAFFNEIHNSNPEVNFIAVENTLTALQKAAGKYVEKFPSLIKVAVTGSSGKTTTKEILAAVLARKYRVVTNKGNLNSETGLPLSVFNIRKEHEAGVFEMGMNRENEIGEISAVLKAHYAIVTNIGTAHIGLLGSRDNIAREKAKVFDHFDSQSTGVIPFDDDYAEFLEKQIRGKCIHYGKDTDSVKFIADLGLKGTEFSVGKNRAVLKLPGKYNYKNALGAIALCQELGVSDSEIAQGINDLEPMFGRSQVIEDKYTIVQDCYNANPDSMEKSIEFVSSVTSGEKKIFVLGDMLELGADSEKEHEKTGIMAAESSADKVFFVGTEMENAYKAACKKSSGDRFVYCSEKTDDALMTISLEIKKEFSEHSIVLIKASRGMGLERLTKFLCGAES